MADLDDVMSVLATACAVSVYPKGLAQPSVAGVLVRAVQGWPDATALNKDLAAGNMQVSVYPLAMERNTTRFQRVWQVLSIEEATLTLTVESDTVTVGGEMPSPFSAHNLAVLIYGVAYLYAVQAGDTLNTIATALATLISANYPLTTSVGPMITVGGLALNTADGEAVTTSTGDTVAVGHYPEPIVARVGTVGTSVREVRRQKRLFQITVWAPTPDTRKAVASALDNALQKTAFLTMPDGSAAHVTYFDSPMTDMLSTSLTYRRDLRYFIEYATTEQEDNATVVVGRVTRQDPVTGNDISITDY